MYEESNTDFDFSYNNISFAYTRTYNSADKVWFKSIDSKIVSTNNRMDIYLPDSSKYPMIRTGENTYVDELCGYTLTKENNQYIFTADDYKYYFDNSNRAYLNAIEDSSGNRFELNRQADLINYIISDGSGRSFSIGLDDYTVDEDLNSIYLNEITDPNGNIIEYISYSSDPDQCNKVTDQAGVIIGEYEYKSTSDNTLVRSMDKSISYYDNGRLKSITYDDGSYINYNYDDANKTYTTLTSAGETTKTVYNDAFLPVEYTDEYGTVTTYTYDDHYRVLNETCDGVTTTYAYDTNDNLLSSITDDEEDNDTYYAYDSNGNVVREQTGDSYTYYTYNSNGNILICAALKEDYTGEIPNLYDSTLTCFDKTEYTYDNKGRVTKEVYNSSDTVEYEYDARGNVTKETSAVTENDEIKTTVTTYTYDSLDNLLTTQCDSETSSYIYDNAGRTLLANENGGCTRTLYDVYGRTVQEIAPEDYDSTKDGLPTANTYSDSNVGHRYVYNDKNQLVKEINRLDVTTDYEYYSTGEKKSESFDIYKFEYNVKGSPTKIYVSGVNTLTYTYDDNNNLLSEAYANGDTIRYTYNDEGNVTAQYRDDSTTPYVTYSYNTDGELTQKINSDSGLKYVYGENNSVSVYKTSDNTLVQSYTETVTQADEEAGTEEYTTVTENHFGTSYTSVIKDKSVSYTTGSNTAEYSYQTDDNSTMTADAVKYGNSVSLSSVYTYDDDSNITSKLYTYKAGGEENVDFINEYDSEGRIVASGYDFFSQYYTYDSNGQLKRADNRNFSDPYTTTHEYDSRGNLLSVNVYSYTRTENITSASQGTAAFAYAESGWKDRLTAVNGYPLTYDANGNVLTYAGRTYTWTDGRNLTSITQGNTTYSYTYDEEGIRTSKTVNGVTTYYTTENGNVTSQYSVDGNGNKFDELTFLYNGDEVMGALYEGQEFYYVKNAMGDVESITDQNGNVIFTYYYNAWGETPEIKDHPQDFDEQKTSDKFIIINPFRYRSYYYDYQTGFYYLQSRYYNFLWGRFLNADDPEYLDINTHVGLNLFAYCNNNPINIIDTSGKGVAQTILGVLSESIDALIRVIEYISNSCNVSIKNLKDKAKIFSKAKNQKKAIQEVVEQSDKLCKKLGKVGSIVSGVALVTGVIESIKSGAHWSLVIVKLVIDFITDLISEGISQICKQFAKLIPGVGFIISVAVAAGTSYALSKYFSDSRINKISDSVYAQVKKVNPKTFKQFFSIALKKIVA